MTLIDQTSLHATKTVAVPGVDLVIRSDHNAVALLTESTRKLVGVLHRRFWSRRQELIRGQSGADNTPDSRASASDPEVPSVTLADLRSQAASSWDGRLDEYAKVAAALDHEDVGVVKLRGWSETEPAMLVDGRPVPGSVFDLAVLLSLAVEPCRDGFSPIALSIVAPADSAEARLWTDLVSVAEDRLGIDRGVVRVLVEPDTSNDELD